MRALAFGQQQAPDSVAARSLPGQAASCINLRCHKNNVGEDLFIVLLHCTTNAFSVSPSSSVSAESAVTTIGP
jgi:hypothetical protein